MVQGTRIAMMREIPIRQALSQPQRGLGMPVVTAFPPLKEIQCFVQLRNETWSQERREVKGGKRESH